MPILVRKTLSCSIEPELVLEDAECVGVKLHSVSAEWIIRSVYFPHNTRNSRADLIKVLSGENIIVGGDWNARNVQWDSVTNGWGRKLADLLPFNNCEIFYPNAHTYIAPTGAGSLIDFFVTNGKLAPRVSTLTALHSDFFFFFFIKIRRSTIGGTSLPWYKVSTE